MAISNNSTGLRPGVCTSTTRPTAPYEGQMIFETDTNRVLVWDNAAWVMIADTNEPPGLQLVKTQTIGTTVASVAVSSAFNSTYDNYKIIVSGSTGTGDVDLNFQLTGSTTGYYGHFVAGSYSTGTIAGYGDNNASSFIRPGFVHSGNSVTLNCDLVQPNLAKYTYIYGSTPQAVNSGGYSGHHRVSSAYTGFTLIVGGGATITGGTISVYGYRK